MSDEQFARRCRALRLILTDVDGVLTDGSLLLVGSSEEGKAFHVRDGLATTLAHAAGLLTGILTGRESAVVARRAAELRMRVVRQGASDKLSALQGILAEHGLEPRQVAFIGDDLNDLAVIREVGLSGAPADAPLEVKTEAFLVTDAPGGRGAYREFVEAILKARGDWEMAISSLSPRPQGS